MGRLNPRDNNGFTLLELMVVLVLMVSVYALALPVISTVLPGTELKSAARQLGAGLRKARSEAITKKIQSSLIIDVEQREFSFSGEQRHYALPKNIEIGLKTAESELLGDNIGAIRFYPDGSSTGGQITVALNERTYLVSVDWLTGQVAIVE